MVFLRQGIISDYNINLSFNTLKKGIAIILAIETMQLNMARWDMTVL